MNLTKVLVILFICLIFVGAAYFILQCKETKIVKEEPILLKPKPSVEKQVYQIIQSTESWPKILEAIIEPQDVHVGDRQKLSIIVQSKEDIKSVVAYIETDNGKTAIPLGYKGTAISEVVPKYILNSRGMLTENKLEDGYKKNEASLMKSVSDENLPKLKYEGSWIVRDTHDKYYHTTFVVEDSSGNKNSITLAWSDACGIPRSGNWTISANCTISSTDGVDKGDAIIQNYTLTLNSTFVFNPGHHISVGSGGVIAIGTSGQIKKTYLWITDADSDNHAPPSYSQVAQDTEPSGYSRRATTPATDCNDSNANLWQYLTGYIDSDGDGYGAGSAQQVCSGSSLPSGYVTNDYDCDDDWADIWRIVLNLRSDDDQDGYTDSISLTRCVGNSTSISGRTYYWSGYAYNLIDGSSLLGTWDCNDNNASVWRIRHRDADGDGYGVAANSCVGNDAGYVDDNTDCDDSNANLWQYLTGYIDSDGDGYGAGSARQVCSGSSLPSGYVTNNADCYDLNAAAHPGADWQPPSSGDRGDGSWDYDCNGIEDHLYTGVAACSSAPVSECASAGYNCTGSTPYCVHVTSPGWVTAESACGVSSGGYYFSTGYGCTDAPGNCLYGSFYPFSQWCR